MMGPRQEAQSALFYEFCLEDHVPADHMLRSIDRFVDLDDIRQHLGSFYSSTGRPSVDPELMIRILLVGYCMGIRSERRLCEEVHLNLAYRWFCRLDLGDAVPDHSTFSKNRHGRFRDSDLLRHVFETVVARCIAEGLVSGQRFAVDASLIAADANRQNSTSKEEWQSDKINPEAAPRAVREYLETLDDAAFGAATTVNPKFTSHSDPASQWTAARKGPAYFAYSTNYLIDTDNAVILDVEATRTVRQAEVGAARTMIDRVAKSFDLHPERLIADTAYGSAPMLEWLVKGRGIAPHIPVIDKSGRKDGTFERADFTHDTKNDLYICPGGKELKQNRRAFTIPRTPKPDKEGIMRYRAKKSDCDACGIKAQCTPKEPQRKILRSIYEPSRNVARNITKTIDYAISCKLRKKVEMLFAHLKRILKLDRLRLRGPCGVKDEFHLAATAQNLRKLAKLIKEPSQTA
ncbi:IS1182 family transposase [Maritalea porphyrae]|uniref:IS1182 family transposase n=1 Tax=Maritalea porphyrae TaxID=880732 RepID=UPI0022B00EA8|nr:IS1182 family transposase [Maritalea porphyrae]MCZ4274128.1 IS1182 family transposase [Maritalea porphyrae]